MFDLYKLPSKLIIEAFKLLSNNCNNTTSAVAKAGTVNVYSPSFVPAVKVVIATVAPSTFNKKSSLAKPVKATNLLLDFA